MARDQRTTRRRSPQQSKQHAHEGHPSLFTAVLGIAGGIGIGAGLMYLMDPTSGRDRRTDLADRAGDLAHSALNAAREHASGASSAIAAAAPAMREKLMDHAGEARDYATNTASGWMESARSHLPSYSDVRDKLSSYVPFQRRRRSNVAPMAATAAGAGLAALAIGATAMWLFDPERGRSRRAWIGQKLTRATNETGQFMRATGRHLANKGRGVYHESRSVAKDAMEGAVAHLHPGKESEPQWGTAQNPAQQEPSVPSI